MAAFFAMREQPKTANLIFFFIQRGAHLEHVLDNYARG